MRTNGIWSCDFCGESQSEVEKIIAGTNEVAICNRCVCTSLEIILKSVKDAAVADIVVHEKDKKTMPKGGS